MSNPGRDLLLSHVSEKDWQAQVRRWAEREGWYVHCVYDSRRSPDGWPDLFLVRNGRAIAVELKSPRGRISPAQQRWLTRLRECGIPAYVWKPDQEDEVRHVLGVAS